MRLRVIGPGRAGTSLERALAAAGWDVATALGRGDDLLDAAAGVDLLVLATPDAAVAEVAAMVRPAPATVVAHLAGSLGVAVLAPHTRRAAIHPLRSLPAPGTDLRGAWFAVAGDPVAARVGSHQPQENRAAGLAAKQVAADCYRGRAQLHDWEFAFAQEPDVDDQT